MTGLPTGVAPLALHVPPIADVCDRCEFVLVRRLHTFPLIAVVGLAACQVRLPIEEARAEGVDVEQVRADAPAGTPVQAKGPWTEVNLSISKASLSKIAWLELYSTLRVVDCRTGALRDIGWPKVNGIKATDFSQLRRLISHTRSQRHYWLVGYVLHSPPGSCAHLEGGSYLGQKISSDSIPIKFE